MFAKRTFVRITHINQRAVIIDAFTETRWVTVRGDITPYPFQGGRR
jgi:hypothetical protein